MLFDADLLNSVCAEATNAAVYLQNQFKSLQGKSTELAWSAKKAQLRRLRIFECKSHALISKESQKK